MREKPIRILQCVNKMDRAGLETMLMNYYRNIERSKIQFDFLTHRKERGAYDEEIEMLGGRIFHAPRLIPGNYIKYFKYMKHFFIEHPEYKIVHSHIDTMSSFPLRAALKAKVPIRISHSHTSRLDIDYKMIIKYIAKMQIKKYANNYFACGEEAGKFLYGDDKNVVLVKNAIDIDKYSFSEIDRERLRKELGISKEEIVIGHVGRYVYIKNQIFLIELLAGLLQESNNYKLVLVGCGPDEVKLRKAAKKLNVVDKIIFLIDRNDVNEIYNVFDIFVMPSLFEGMPLVGVEAQCNGLDCLFNDTISKEVLLTDTAQMMSLKLGKQMWKKAILNRNVVRNINSEKQVREAGFDIKVESKKLEKIYTSLLISCDNK